jgi:hypothetical protein
MMTDDSSNPIIQRTVSSSYGMNDLDRARWLKENLQVNIGALLLEFYDKTGIKVEAVTVIINEMPDGNVTGFYVQVKAK